MSDDFQRTLTWSPAYDRRDPDPSKNYGVHGMDARWVLSGPKGATQFLLFTQFHLPHVLEEFRRLPPAYLLAPTPADLGYHADEPQWEGQEQRDCDLRPAGKCFYDGSGLNANRVYAEFAEHGEDALWRELESFYRELFEAVAA